jgi:hypothetical protein
MPGSGDEHSSRKNKDFTTRCVVRNWLCATVALTVTCLPLSSQAGRSITLPHEERFDTNAWLSDLPWVGQGGTVTWEQSGGWGGGGAVKITPPTLNEGYAGLGAFNGFGNQTQFNVRFLAWFGSSYAEKAQGVKHVIVHRGTALRPMEIENVNQVNGELRKFWTPCLGTVCALRNPNDRTDQPFYVSGTHRVNEWVSIEFETDLLAGRVNLYIHTQDGQVSGLYSSFDMSRQESPPFTNYPVTELQGIGFYWGQPDEYAPVATRDEHTYMKVDEVRLDSRYIGPPAGFLDNPPPGAPTNLRRAP